MAKVIKTERLDTARQEIKEWQKVESGAVFEIGRILSEIRSETNHGEWTVWLHSVGYTPRTAQRYAQIYERFGEIDEARGLSVSKLTELLSIPVDVDAFTLRKFIDKAAESTVKWLRNYIRSEFGRAESGKHRTQSDKETTTGEAYGNEETGEAEEATDMKDARIRRLERQVSELAKERDKYKQAAENEKERADEAERKYYQQILYGSSDGGVTPYDILGVDMSATSGDIRKRYRQLMKLLHPDHAGDAKLFDTVRKAYEQIR